MNRTLVAALLLTAGPLCAQQGRRPLPIPFENSAELRWLAKPVLAQRQLDAMSDSATWRLQGHGRLSFAHDSVVLQAPILRVDMHLFGAAGAPTRNGLSTINLRRSFNGEDWRAYNRISFWVRPDVQGFPMLPIGVVLHNEGAVKVPDVYDREGTHYITLQNGKWQHVVWEIPYLARDRVTSLEIGYWVNKRITMPDDKVAFEIADLRLEKVAPDPFAGWTVQSGTTAYSHSGYLSGFRKQAVLDTLSGDFELVRLDDNAQPEVLLRAPLQRAKSRLGEFGIADFSSVDKPGTYVLKTPDGSTRPFRIGTDVWRSSIIKTLNFFYGERCGFAVPGLHDVDHQDWLATHNGDTIVMNGGWHDAGDLSQGLINTGEATYAMFALAEHVRERGDDPELLALLLDEGKWGLDWLLKVRFPGGYRIGFASNNLWTDNIIGTADDRTRAAVNNPNVNYIAAAAEALAARVLRESDPALATRALAVAREDWQYAIVGKETPQNWSTPAFAASAMEIASIGVLASTELYRATGEAQFKAKAFELADTIVASQQIRYVGSKLPLAGFFYTGPDKREIFHQFHRGNDQAPIVALASLVEQFPDHARWMKWYAAIARYGDYQLAGARTTAPWFVLPAYVYTDSEYLQVPDSGALHRATRAAYREQVLNGLDLGDGYYLRAFPVWFARRGNYGVLLSQTKALTTVARIRDDATAFELAQIQAQWVIGRNPFGQSTLYGEGYDWTQQYSVSTGDIVGALPVGIESWGNLDVPYWPAQNMYVYKEVWVHPSARWLWLMREAAWSRTTSDAAPATGPALDYTVRVSKTSQNKLAITLTASGSGTHTFQLRTENLNSQNQLRRITLQAGRPAQLTWSASVVDQSAPWYAVVVADGAVGKRQEVRLDAMRLP